MASNTIAQAPAAVTASNVTSVSKSFASSCTNGSKLVAACTGESVSITHTVADDANSGNYTPDIVANNSAGSSGHGRASIHSIDNTSTASVQVTLTYSASAYGVLQIYELTNAGGTPAIDSTGSDTNDSSAAASLPITTIAADCSIIGVMLHYQALSPTTTVDTGFASRLAATAVFLSYHAVEDDDDVGAAGAKTLTFGSYSGEMAFVAAAYAPPAAGGGGGFRSRIAGGLVLVG